MHAALFETLDPSRLVGDRISRADAPQALMDMDKFQAVGATVITSFQASDNIARCGLSVLLAGVSERDLSSLWEFSEANDVV